ncbi:MAG: acyl--CoA ligase [Proteobacteria bacterium]|nr:acyl--CoA ligase [Pseudomonadota bacterium]MBU1417283.1 acyl--CoA ligase [Pseudomonadota bacterium]MBU1453974.1 acyl--CoA ligase [Pseudomonadota bacterium]
MTLSRLYQQALKQAPESTALRIDSQSCTYRELDRRVQEYAKALVKLGVRQGDRVGLFMPNCLEIVYCYFACFRLGAIAVPSSYYSRRKELLYEVGLCKTRIYIAHRSMEGEIRDLERETDSLKQIFYLSHSSKGDALDDSWEELVATAREITLPEIQTLAHDPAAIFYTSGSTGRPKGVTHTHGSLFHAASNRCRTFDHTADHVFMTTSYLCHCAAPTILLLPMLLAGGTAVFMSHFTSGDFLGALSNQQVTHAAASPSQWREFTDLVLKETVTFPSLIYATSGGSAVPLSLQDDFFAATGVELTASMGMTECGGYMTVPPNVEQRRGSLGRPAYDTMVRLVDDRYQDVAAGETGQMLVKSPSVMKKYWKDPQSTAAAFEDGWFITGDLARQDKDGYFFFMGRCKNTIIRDSGNISPEEVEDALGRHPDVRQAIVTGVPDPVYEQAVFAFIQPLDPTAPPSTEELDAFLAGQLAARKIPQFYHIIDDFQVKGLLEKIDRKVLQELACKIRQGIEKTN